MAPLTFPDSGPADSRVWLKLCGFVRTEDVEQASHLDVDAIGIVLAGDARVPLTPHQVGELLRATDPQRVRVAVVGPRSEDECRRILDLGFDAVQVVVTDWIALDLDGRPVIPVFFDGADVEARAAAFLRAAPEATRAVPLVCIDGARGGGRGEAADQQHAERIARMAPLLLAGGLKPENVRSALLAVRPSGVDVSSGIETGSGVKDAAKMAAFVAAVRATEAELC